MSNDTIITARRCSCWHQTRTHAEGSGQCRGRSREEQERSCLCVGTHYFGCVCPPRADEPCPCEAFELAAVRILDREWAGATDGGPVCGSPFPGTSYTCDLDPHDVGRHFLIDTELTWHGHPVAVEAVAS